MKQRIVVVLLISLLFWSCSDDSTPSPPGPSLTFIGGFGTQRAYLTTESWFVPFTDTPFVAVPDSLLSRITLSDSLRKLGVVVLQEQVESVKAFDTSYYNWWNLPLPRLMYKMSETVGPHYSLYDELQRLASGNAYRTPGSLSLTTWYEDATQVQNVLPHSYWVNFPPLPWLRKPLHVGDTWIRYQFIDTSSGSLHDQRSVKVLGQVEITTKAGTFQAYKMVLFSLGGNPPELSNEFEYYVPDIGLVLYEDDRELSVRTIRPNGGGSTTISYRQVIRKELTSFTIRP